MTKRIAVVENILSANDRIAQDNREKFDRAGILALNFMASPGAGKTSLIERTIRNVSDRFQLANAAVPDQFADSSNSRVRTPLTAGLENASVGPDCLDHLLPVADGQRHRLLAKDVLSGVGRHDGHRAVPMIGRDDGHRVDVVSVDDLPEVAIRVHALELP